MIPERFLTALAVRFPPSLISWAVRTGRGSLAVCAACALDAQAHACFFFSPEDKTCPDRCEKERALGRMVTGTWLSSCSDPLYPTCVGEGVSTVSTRCPIGVISPRTVVWMQALEMQGEIPSFGLWGDTPCKRETVNEALDLFLLTCPTPGV